MWETPSSLQHVATLPNPQHLYLDSLCSLLPNWSGHPQFHIYKNWRWFKQHAIQLKHNTNIYKTINSNTNMAPGLGSPEVEISSSHPSWPLSAPGCATRQSMPGCWFWLLVWHMRLSALISRYISWIHLWIRHISLMPSPHRKPCLAIFTVLSENERLFN